MTYRLLTTIVCLCSCSPLLAHPPRAWEAQQQALSGWAQALSAYHTNPDSVASPPPGAMFSGEDTRVDLSHVVFSTTASGVLASPVVITVDDPVFLIPIDVQLTETGGAWAVSAIAPSSTSMPEALVPRDLPEHQMLHDVDIQLIDGDSGQPVHARVRIVDERGEYWPPHGHRKNIRTGWRHDVGGDVRVDDKNWAYVAPSFSASLADGEYTIEAMKGTEYLPAKTSFRVDGSNSPAVPVSLERWSNVNAQGWYAGDTHTHFLSEQTAMRELRAEDLSIIYVLATKWGELITDVERFTGAPSAYSTPTEVVVYNEETRHGWLGHTILHGIKELVYPLTWGGPSEGVAGGHDYPAMAHQADRAHEQGGLVTWAHFPAPGGELAVDIGLNKIDTVDLFTWGDAFGPGQFRPDGSQSHQPLELWYRFLNTGSRLPATAGTDKMLNVQVSGSVRTWAHIGEEFSYPGWMNALRAGRTFVSTGPIIHLTANGAPIGSQLDLSRGSKVLIQAKVQAPFAHYPIERLEIVVGGTVVAGTANDDQASSLELSAEIDLQKSTWVAARANGSKLLPYQKWALLGTQGIPAMAHTSPIYLMADDAEIWSRDDAAVLAQEVRAAIDWAKSKGNYLNDAQREEIVSLYERALKIYQK